MSRDEADKTDDYKVGKNKPPKEFQWGKGVSGNPGGRPVARKLDQLDLAGVLNSPVKAKIRGKEAKISASEASFRQTSKMAVEGELRSIRQFLNQCEKFGILGISESKKNCGVLHAPKDVDFYDWLEKVTEWLPVDEQ